VPAYLEPNACVCHYDPQGNLTVWCSTQNAFMVRGILAEVLGIPVNKIRVIVEHMGGAFGGKQDIYQVRAAGSQDRPAGQDGIHA
jgi:xanthine dehydrogenase molybdenum-binding subunit